MLNNIKYNFKTIRKNALSNPNLYDGRYSQKNPKDAYISYLEDSLIKALEIAHNEKIKNLNK